MCRLRCMLVNAPIFEGTTATLYLMSIRADWAKICDTYD